MNGRDLAVESFLLSTYPLLRLARGERKEQLNRSWIDCALSRAGSRLGIDEGRLPEMPKDAAVALLASVLELCECAGLSRLDLIESFNARGEAGMRGSPENLNEAIERCMALLSVFVARSLQAP